MSEIKCPKCGTVFTIDEKEYDSIVKQVKDVEFEKALQERLKVEKDKNQKDIEIAKQQEKITADARIKKLEEEILKLNEKISSAEKDKALAVNEANRQNDSKINELNNQVMSLKNEIKLKEADAKLEIQKAVNAKDKEIDRLNNDLKSQKDAEQLHIKDLNERHAILLKDKDEQIAFYKDLKTRMSTKLVGETLEQHCQIEFNKIRMTAFPTAYFEKDNDAKTGSKGDFIFKEKTEQGAELISIMFEMKNENDETATKHKNEDFLKELDKDRTEKGCEYAVLVSMLEPENELYNAGIVDMSYRYPKMYVVRPQCFIPIITLLRNAALNSAQFKNELMVVRAQNLDITNFEQELNDFKADVDYNVNLGRKKFVTAIEEIDKTIAHLQKVRENLTGSENNLRIANDKVQSLTVKKLTKNSPKLREELKNK